MTLRRNSSVHRSFRPDASNRPRAVGLGIEHGSQKNDELAAGIAGNRADMERLGGCWEILVRIQFAAVCLIFIGCGDVKSIDDTYGMMSGKRGGASVNGTGVLADMFAAAGYRVTSVHRLSPRLERFDVIVWFPDDFRPPGPKQREFLEKWLAGGRRTLVYVGRDFDAATFYWEKMAVAAPQDQMTEIKRRWAMKQSEHDTARRAMPKEEDAGWFLARRDGRRQRIRQLQGPWSKGIDDENVEIQVQGRLGLAPISSSTRPADIESEDETPAQFEVTSLLTSGRDEVIVSRVTRAHWGESKIVVVANGSYLLNLPLVNREHRKLAGRLISECSPPGKVAFLESGPSGPAVSNADPTGNPMLQAFAVWPSNCILLHLTLAGIVFCFSVFPIFGPAHQISSDTRSDFGKHVSAVGSFLQRSRAQQYAELRLLQYHNATTRDRGHSPFKTFHSPSTPSVDHPAAATAQTPTVPESRAPGKHEEP